jgi:hypothetical protein
MIVQLIREYREEFGQDVLVHQDLIELLKLPINGKPSFARIWQDKVSPDTN